MKYFDRTVHVNPNQAPMKAALARTVIFDIPLIGMSSLRSTSYAAGGLVTLCLTFSCSLIGMSSLRSTSRARGGISHALRAFSLAARRGGPCKALTIRSYATKGRYFVSAHYLTRASS